jgi:purine-cytosine permease-like protein
MVVSSFAIGVLGQGIFFMGMKDSALTILFFNLIGIIPVCYFSTFGPLFGLRQMVLSRYWFGWYGVKLIAVFNVMACIGWSSVNAIVGAQLIHATNNNVNGAAGIVIIAVCTFFVCLFGYKVVHSYEFWSWIPVFMSVVADLLFMHANKLQHLPHYHWRL